MQDNEIKQVVLPVPEKDFATFLNSLLGKPQVIEKYFDKVFHIEREHLCGLHHRLVNRLEEQNDAKLIQFRSRIGFSDDSTVLLNDFNEFENFNEKVTEVSKFVVMEWDFLIKFQGRETPEKQTIDISFYPSPSLKSGLKELVRLERLNVSNIGMKIRIKHTARTWAADIESLLTKYINSLVTRESTFNKFLSKYSERIGFFFGSLVIVIPAIFLYYISWQIEDQYKAAIMRLTEENNISEKISKLGSIVSQGSWERFAFYSIGIIIISIFIGLIMGTTVGEKCSLHQKSYLLLTNASYRDKETNEKSLNKQFAFFILTAILSIVLGIVSGVIANYLFAEITSSN